MIGYIIGLFLIGWFGFIIYVCMIVSSRCSNMSPSRDLYETCKDAYKNYKKNEKGDDEIESAEKE